MDEASDLRRKRFDLHGRVALISGAASGMGRASAIALAQHGADLLLADLNADGLARTAEVITGLGRRAVAVAGDVSNADSIQTSCMYIDHIVVASDWFTLLRRMYEPSFSSASRYAAASSS